MAKYGPDDFGISIDDDEGGSPTDISAHVDTLDGFSIEAILEQANTFGDSWVEQLYSGLRRANEFTIGGFFDDGSSPAPKAIFNNSEGEQRSVVLTWGGSTTSSFEVFIREYRRLPTREGSTRYEVVLVPTGAVTEA